MDSTPLWLLATVVLPLWLAAGVGDWVCHRVTRIEATSGWRESALHAAQLAEVGAIIVAALLFEPNGALVGFAVAMIVAHEVTVWIDLRYAGRLRHIPPVEQMIHAVLEILPWTALLLLLAHAWPSLDALAASIDDLEPRLADYGVPVAWRLGLAASIGAFAVAPYAEELWRCWRARERTAAASPVAG